ncbi:MAG TPA: Ig-like domain-containing protein, partial [Polyangiales bacterium]
MRTRLRTSHTLAALAFALLCAACAETGDSDPYEAGLAPGLTPDAQADAASRPAERGGASEAGWRVDASFTTQDAAPSRLDAGDPTLDALLPVSDADDPSGDTGTPVDAEAPEDAANSRDTGATLGDAGATSDASTTGAVALAWAEPAANSTLKGSVTLRFTGRAFQNVEVFLGGTRLVRASVSADRTSASATLDTTKLNNGSVSLTAHAWNSP